MEVFPPLFLGASLKSWKLLEVPVEAARILGRARRLSPCLQFASLFLSRLLKVRISSHTWKIAMHMNAADRHFSWSYMEAGMIKCCNTTSQYFVHGHSSTIGLKMDACKRRSINLAMSFFFVLGDAEGVIPGRCTNHEASLRIQPRTIRELIRRTRGTGRYWNSSEWLARAVRSFLIHVHPLQGH